MDRSHNKLRLVKLCKLAAGFATSMALLSARDTLDESVSRILVLMVAWLVLIAALGQFLIARDKSTP